MTLAQHADRFGVDLITFYDGQFWSLGSYQELADRAAAEPHWFWDRLLSSVALTGVTGIELTFPPGDWDGALAAYGSAEEFRRALSAYGLAVTSSYFSELENAADISDSAQQDAIVKAGAQTARLLRTCGADVLVAGLPPRPRAEDGAARFVDLAYASSLAGLLNQLGAATRAEGVRLAIHTETGSVFSLPRDIDLFMLLTDPEYVGICPDTGHIVLAGGDPLSVLRRYGERVLLTHWKDATGPMPADRPPEQDTHAAYAARFRRVGTGVVDWFAWARRLREAGFSGWNVLEIDQVADPVQQIRGAREFAAMASHRAGL
jgi:sugar phosphate isomerase/epimerase